MKPIKGVSSSDVALLKSSDFFDEAWYLERYKDVRLMEVDPVEHYLWIGHKLGRSPSPKFCGISYMKSNWDVKVNALNPLVHYLRFGFKENRMIYPVSSGNPLTEQQKCRRIVTRHNDTWDWTAHEILVRGLDTLPYRYVEDKVSVIMPTYNRSYMIGAAIRSVLNQTHTNLELIIVDDNSADNTAEVVTSFTDSRIIYTVNRAAKGVSGARNTGLEMASGKWVFFLDSDNAWSNRMIEFMLKHADKSQSSAGYCAANLLGDDQKSKCILYADFDYESLLNENYVDLNCFFMRWAGPFQDFRFDQSLRRLVDWDFILHVASQTRVTGIPFVGVDYYDGTSARVSNQEHVDQDSISSLMHRIREKARPKTVEMSTIRDSSAYRIAVHLHAYHPERVPECLDYLRKIRFDFDLYVSTSLEEDHEALALVRTDWPNARIFRYPNVGADIGPFLELISTFKNYQLLLKIHTKRDVEPWGDTWRKGLLEPLLGSSELVNAIAERFRDDDRLAMACSAEFYKYGASNSIMPSLVQLEILAKEVDLSQHLDKDWAFVAGTMFWVRPHLYLKLARHMCDSEGYSAQFMRDGAVEHGLERALGLALWQNDDNRIALVAMDGKMNDVELGEGQRIDGVLQSMRRLHAS